jgi:hypothetical protein
MKTQKQLRRKENEILSEVTKNDVFILGELDLITDHPNFFVEWANKAAEKLDELLARESTTRLKTHNQGKQ